MYLTHNCIIMLSLLANKLLPPPPSPLSTTKLTDFSPPTFDDSPPSFLSFPIPSLFLALSVSLHRTDFSTPRRSREKLLEDVGGYVLRKMERLLKDWKKWPQKCIFFTRARWRTRVNDSRHGWRKIGILKSIVRNYFRI